MPRPHPPSDSYDDHTISSPTSPSSPHTPSLSPSPPPMSNLKEIGNLASWTVSTAKPGNGIDQLRDDDTTLFWQSDGPQPHYINIHFAKRVKIAKIRMFLDFEHDESYTPTKLSVWAGTGYADLEEVSRLELERPCGWVECEVAGASAEGEVRACLVQVRVLANHQNGKDTHVRGLQVWAREQPRFEQGELMFTTGKMLDELELR